MDQHDKPGAIDCGLGHACQFCALESTCALDKPHHNRRLIEARLEGIDQIVLVLANKGGVGKSTVAANLAAGLAQRGMRVGVADADIHGPNQSRFFGFAGERVRVADAGLATRKFSHAELEHPVKVGSLAFLLEREDTPVVWRDAYKHDFVHHLIGSFDWGPLDFLIVDMPPGTGNELITLCDLLEGANVSALLVTTSQAVALMDTMKAVRFCRERGLPLLGAVQNMAGVVCPHCLEGFHIYPNADLDRCLEEAEVQRLAQIPLAVEIAFGSDEGVPVVVADPQSAVAQSFLPLVEACTKLGRTDFDAAVAHALDDAFARNLDPASFEAALAGLDDATRGELSQAVSEALDEESARLHAAATQRSREIP